ncbi:hypothetical protein MAUB1S_02470 [Mycolicibacterium aubagnense]
MTTVSKFGGASQLRRTMSTVNPLAVRDVRYFRIACYDGAEGATMRIRVLWVLSIVAVSFVYVSATQMALRVASVGGSCASGGPYAIRQQCPTGTGHWTLWLMLSLLAAVVLLFVDAGNSRVSWFIWSAIFLGMGVGGVVGAIAALPDLNAALGLGIGCGVVGLVIACLGVLGLVKGADAVQAWKAKLEGRPQPKPPAPKPSAAASPQQLDKLLQLAERHGRGELSDDEYAAAKAKILGKR